MERLFAEQTRILFEQTKVAIITTIINSAIVTAILWDGPSRDVIVAWLSVLLLIQIPRYILTLRYFAAAPSSDQAGWWNKWYFAGTLASGIVWGSSTILFFPGETLVKQVFVALILAGMSAGSVMSYAVLFRVFLGFAMPIMIPLSVAFVMQGDTISVGIGIATGLFAVVCFMYGARVHETLVTSLRLRYENAELVEYLATAKADAEKLNTELQSLYKIHKDTLDNSPAGIVTLDKDLCIAYMNPAMKAILGVPENEEHKALGQKVSAISSINQAGLAQYIDKITGGEKIKIEVPFVSLYGKRAYMSLTAEPVMENDVFTGANILALDITEQKRAEDALRESEEQYRDLYENANDMLYTHDLEGRFTSANKSLLELVGYRAEEFVGRTADIIVAPEYMPRIREMIERKLKGEPSTKYELEFISRNGRKISVEVNSRLISKDGVFVGVQGIGREMTERKQAEDDLRRAKEKAEAATRMKDKFVSLVAHDLRSPIGTVMGLLNVFITSDGALLPAQKDILRRVGDISSGMLHMIEQLLNISRLQTGTMQLRRRFFDGGDTVSEAMDKLNFVAEQKGIRFENRIGPGMRLYADYELYSEALQNIISNAVKFCRPGDTITFFTMEDQPGVIAIKDNGPGINKNILPDLFRHDVKTTTTGASGEKGSGLGLPLCKDIMDAHGGSIAVESATGVGTVFYLGLPEVKPTVLITDDEEFERMLFRMHLKSFNLEILEAENGAAAMEIIEKIKPHLVITDVMMPKVDGFTLLRRIKENPMTKFIPVIVATSSSDITLREKAFAFGANDFVTRPIDDVDFIPRVRRFVR